MIINAIQYQTSGGEVNIYPVSLSMISEPDVTEYSIGQSLDLAGMILSAHYNNGLADIMDYDSPKFTYQIISGSMSQAGDVVIQFSYTAFNTTVTMNYTVVVFAHLYTINNFIDIEFPTDSSYDNLFITGWKDENDNTITYPFSSYGPDGRTYPYHGVDFDLTPITANSIPTSGYVGIGGSKTISGSTSRSYFNSTTSSPNTAVKEIVLDDGITSIGNYAFMYMKGVTHLRAQGTLSSIGRYAFSNMTSLKVIDLRNTTRVPSVSDTNAFTSVNALEAIYVPSNLVSYFKSNSGWKAFADQIVGV